MLDYGFQTARISREMSACKEEREQLLGRTHLVCHAEVVKLLLADERTDVSLLESPRGIVSKRLLK